MILHFSISHWLVLSYSFVSSRRHLGTFLSSFQGQWFWLLGVSPLDWPVVSLPVSNLGSHRCQLLGSILYPFHRRGILISDQLHLYLRCFQEDDQVGWLLPHQLRLQSGLQHHLFLCLHPAGSRWGCYAWGLHLLSLASWWQIFNTFLEHWGNSLILCFLSNCPSVFEVWGIKTTWFNQEVISRAIEET